MRNTLSILLIVLASAGTVNAQPTGEVPHLIRVLVRPQAIAPLRAAFAMHRVREHDIQQIILHESDSIGSLLGLPPTIHITRFAPFAAQHSAVFEDIRERLNPGLFHGSDASVRANPLNDLAIAEDKLSRWFTLEFSNDISPERVILYAHKSSLIELSEPVFVRKHNALTNDPLLDSQYYLKVTHTLAAWGIQQCDSTMVVASIDGGVSLDHEDLAAAIWHNSGEMGTDAQGNDKSSNGIDDDSDGFVDDWQGWDFSGFFGSSSSNHPTSESDHAHIVAGILAAVGNNNIGIAGEAFGARLMVIKAESNFPCQDEINSGFQGILYAVDHGAKVISCSWGSSGRSQADQDVIDYAYFKNACVVCSAGNNGTLAENYPSSFDHAFAVTALASDGSVKNYANSSTHVAVGAPGDSILSTLYPDLAARCPLDLCGSSSDTDASGYGEMCGTSMSAPQAAGALALIRQHWPNATNRWAMERLRATCDPILLDPHPGFNGRGMMNVYRALSDAHAYSLRLERAQKLDTIRQWIVSGESAQYRLVLKNYLDSLPDANVTLQLLDVQGNPLPNGGHFALDKQTIGPMSSMGPMDSSIVTISITADSTTPPQTDLLVRLWLSDSSVGYTGDYDYFVVHANPGYATVHNNLAVTITDNGAIGFRDATLDQHGDGFRWMNAPSQIRVDGRDVLLGGGLIIASDSSHVVDAIGGFNSGGDGATFTPIQPLSQQTKDTGDFVFGSFSDSIADASQRVGVRVNEECYAEPGAAANGVILAYSMARTDIPSSFTHLDAGIYMDWDIGEFGLRDSTWFDARDSIFYTQRNEPGYATVAMKIAEVFPIGSPIRHYALNNSYDTGRSVSGVFSQALKWDLFQQNNVRAGQGDVAVLLGANLDFTGGETSIVYGMALGVNAADARKNLQLTIGRWNGTLDVKPGSRTGSGIEVWPSPATQRVRVELRDLPAGLPLSIRASDMLGRVVLRTSVANGDEIDLSHIPSGLLAIEVSGQGTSLTRIIIKQ
ncbi:MAG: S8 family peptidase [Bacteroidota bacterium]|nr:S8 family peptidase [Bacteroidota bacterium]MDP4231885.1 S8 family peptidase [Bacteroidota bacterium]MDP4241408.1 S8 family peptidase [Bacteroidota bacterium]MDP4287331.1 S8 family peptidase [Bacteroidota bacterium]